MSVCVSIKVVFFVSSCVCWGYKGMLNDLLCARNFWDDLLVKRFEMGIREHLGGVSISLKGCFLGVIGFTRLG